MNTSHKTQIVKTVSAFKDLNRFALLAIILLISNPLQAALKCDNEEMRLSCFDAYKYKLKPFHYPQLTKIADRVAESFKTDKPYNQISIIGHGVKYKASDPYAEMSIKRASETRKELERLLKKRHISLSRISIVDGGASADIAITKNNNKKGRAINRRVEIVLSSRIKPSKRKAEETCKPDVNLVKKLKTMNPTGLNIPKKARLRRLRSLYVGHFSCDFKLDAYYKNTEIGGGDLLQDFKALKNCSKDNARSTLLCMNKLHNQVMFMINNVSIEIVSLLEMGSKPKDVRATEECGAGRYFLKKANSKRSVYSAFKPLIQTLFKVCK